MNRGRPKQFDHEQVLETAMNVFWKQGYAETSVRMIGQECGVGLQSIYNEFGSKEQLYAQALDHYCEDRVGNQIASFLNSDPAIEGLRALFDFWVEFHSDSNTHGCFLAQTLVDFSDDTGTPVATAARRHHQRNEKLFRLALERARAEGSVPEDLDVRSTSRALVTLSTGVAALGRSQVSRSFLTDVSRAARRLIGDRPERN